MIPRAGLSSTAARRGAIALAAALLAGSSGAFGARARRPPGRGDRGGTVAPLVERVKGAVVTIKSTKFIRRVAVEDRGARCCVAVRPAAPQARPRSRRPLVRVHHRQERHHPHEQPRVAAPTSARQAVGTTARCARAVLGATRHGRSRSCASTSRPATWQAVPLGDSDRVRVELRARHPNPLGLGQTVRWASSARRTASSARSWQSRPALRGLLQTDARDQQGNSGGPLSISGRGDRINSAIINPGVAMKRRLGSPSTARQNRQQIRRSGKVARGYLGVGGEDFTRSAPPRLRVPFTPGALVNVVRRGSPPNARACAPRRSSSRAGRPRRRELPPPPHVVR